MIACHLSQTMNDITRLHSVTVNMSKCLPTSIRSKRGNVPDLLSNNDSVQDHRNTCSNLCTTSNKELAHLRLQQPLPTITLKMSRVNFRSNKNKRQWGSEASDKVLWRLSPICFPCTKITSLCPNSYTIEKLYANKISKNCSLRSAFCQIRSLRLSR